MSFYFRDVPKFSDRLRGKSGNDLLREMKQRFNEDDTFFEPAGRTSRDPFEQHASAFPRGFPFNDNESDFGRRSDGIRAHLDNLASRHPEFAEHLLGPPWGDAPFHSSLLRGPRGCRGSGSSGGQGYQGHQVDEDAYSQASGSSAASGASAVSSHSGEPDSSASTSIPQYGLRNTVDIGQQQRRGMEIPEKSERGQRSMSAPPENRQQQQFDQQQQSRQPQQQQPQQPQGQRFVSRVDITPQHNQQQQRAQSPKPPQSSSSSSSNVRHIPIFVEGRDEPVMPKVTDDASPPSFQRQPSPPQFHRPSHFNDHFARQQWPPSHFQNAFYDQDFEQPMRRQQFQHPTQHYQQPQYYQQPQQPQQPQYYNKQSQQPQYCNQQYHQQPNYQQQPQQPHNQQQQPPSQQQQQQQQQQETLKPKPSVPKDPLEKVAQVQKDVDDLAEQVQRYIGGSRQDKEYVYLDEMLTRELIKLDDIETEGRENVRQARKNAIKSIQDTISLLETKAPLAGQQEQSRGEEEHAGKDQREEAPQAEPMEVDPKIEEKQNEPIPLPPAPSSPTKTKAEFLDKESDASTASEPSNQSVTAAKQDIERTKVTAEQKTGENRATETTEPVVASTTTNESVRADETNENSSKPNDGKDMERKNDDVTQMTGKGDSTTVMVAPQETQTVEEMKEEGKTEVDGQRPRLLKKAKKTKKQQQQPVSEQAIPLPPPPTESAK